MTVVVAVQDRARSRAAIRAAAQEATPVNLADGDPAEQIMDATHGLGADRGIEAVGYQAHDPTGQEHPEMVLDGLVKSVRTTGGIGVVGVYVPSDPGAGSQGAQQGRIGFDYGTFFQKGQAMGTGQCPVKRYNEQLRDLIVAGRAIALTARVARVAAYRGTGRLREVRPAGGRLHQGPPASGERLIVRPGYQRLSTRAGPDRPPAWHSTAMPRGRAAFCAGRVPGRVPCPGGSGRMKRE